MRNLKNRRRQKVFHNFNTAKTAGILFDASDHQNYEAARTLLKFLTGKKIKTTGLGYADSKEVSKFYQYYTGFNFFTIKDTNWLGIPNNHNINDFIDEPLDILIDLHIKENFLLKYICAMSAASTKIGKLNKETDCYDLMIDIKSNPSPEFLSEQIKHYLTVIKNES